MNYFRMSTQDNLNLPQKLFEWDFRCNCDKFEVKLVYFKSSIFSKTFSNVSCTFSYINSDFLLKFELWSTQNVNYSFSRLKRPGTFTIVLLTCLPYSGMKKSLTLFVKILTISKLWRERQNVGNLTSKFGDFLEMEVCTEENVIKSSKGPK